MKIRHFFRRMLLLPPLGGLEGGLLGLLMLALTSCEAETTFTNYPCYLVIDNSIHQDATLASAMNAMSPSVFCMICNDETKQRFVFTNNYGASSVKNFTAMDVRRTRALGMNNALIVGFGTLTGEFYAYDRECPNCFEPQAVPVRSKPLSMGTDGLATCGVCKRRYDMNNGGNCVSEGGVRNMTRYRCGTRGPFGVLNVGN